MIGLENDSPRKWEYPKYQPGDTVALFIPCYVDQLYPEVGRATVEILERLNIPLAFPEKQTCCGQPAFNSGYWEEARAVVAQFCDAFREYKWIVSPSGSCSAMARVFFGQLENSEEFAEIGSRVFELTEFPGGGAWCNRFGGSFSSQGDDAHWLPHTSRVGGGRSSVDASSKREGVDLSRVARHGGLLWLWRNVQCQDARHVSGDGKNEGGERSEERCGCGLQS